MTSGIIVALRSEGRKTDWRAKVKRPEQTVIRNRCGMRMVADQYSHPSFDVDHSR